MRTIDQGEILHLEFPSVDILVLSKEFFNRTGMIIACPIARLAKEDALHISINADGFQGIALLEQLRSLDLSSRHYRKVSEIDYSQLQNITDAVQSIFDYYPY